MEGNREIPKLPADERLGATADTVTKEREFMLKERELAIKEQELVLKQLESKRFRWSNPAVIALAASLATMTGATLQYQQQHNSLELERMKFESNLVLEAVKTSDPKVARQNLRVLLGLGLLRDPDGTKERALAFPEALPLPLPTNPNRK